MSRQFLENTAEFDEVAIDALSFVTGIYSRFERRVPAQLGPPTETLFRVELDDQLLPNGHREVFPSRHALDSARKLLLIELQPLRHAAAIDCAHRLLDALDLLRT